ncbi:MAG: YbaB/EbfC family nucleoid-associated protein [Clostridia bacterium]
MAYGGGFGGGANMQQLMKQAQQMQKKLAEAQEEIAETEVTGSASGGMVEVTLLANKTPVSINIKKEAVDPDDVEMLEDLILAAFNDALAKADAVSKDLMGPLGNTGLF